MIGSLAARFEIFRRVGRFWICVRQASQPPAQSARPVMPAAPAPRRKSRRENRLEFSIVELLLGLRDSQVLNLRRKKSREGAETLLPVMITCQQNVVSGYELVL